MSNDRTYPDMEYNPQRFHVLTAVTLIMPAVTTGLGCQKWLVDSLSGIRRKWNVTEIKFVGLQKFTRWGQEFSLLHVVQAGSGAQPASYPMGAGGTLPGV
jgi:hypothetical protein